METPECPKTCQLFSPACDGLIKAKSPPDRACLLMPRDVHFALTLLVSIETSECIQESHESLPTSFGGCRPRGAKQERAPCCAKQPFVWSDTLSALSHLGS